MKDRQQLIEELLQKKLQDRLTSRSIFQRPDQTSFPLSFTQERIWFLDQLDSGSSVYNRPLALQLRGPLHVPSLERARSEIVRRHEVLRARFADIGGRPFQKITASHPLVLSVKDLRAFPLDQQELQTKHLAQEDARYAFDLANDSLLRATLLRLEDEQHILFLVFHHIAFDAWSARVFIKELAALYEAFSTGRPSPLSELPIQYADFAYWQRERVQAQGLDSQLTYWKQQLAGVPPLLNLSCDHPRPAKQMHRGNCHTQRLSSSLVTSLRTLAQKENVTLYMTLLAAFNVLIHRYSGQEDIVIGSPVAGRTQVETEGLIGCFLNTLAIRTDVSGNPTFQELLQRIRRTTLEAYSHQELPFEKLVEALQPERAINYTPIFQILFNLENFPEQPEEKYELHITEFEFDPGIARFDLTLEIIQRGFQLTCCFTYNSDLFESITIERMTGHFQVLLEGITADPEQRISELPLLTEAERHQILVKWNDIRSAYPADKCIHQLFEAQVKRTPDAVAVIFEEQQLTYQELNKRANQLGHYLQQCAVRAEAVGIYMKHSLELVVGLLGVLKAGGAYLLLDAEIPPERLTFILHNSGARILLTDANLANVLEHLQFHGQVLLWETIPAISQEMNLTADITSGNLVYTIYTSGTTGTPKGIGISHQALVNYTFWLGNTFNLTTRDSSTWHASIGYDGGYTSLWGMLFWGGTLHVISEFSRKDPEQMVDYLVRHHISFLKLIPSFFTMLLHHKYDVEEAIHFIDARGLRVILIGGEQIMPEDVRTFLTLRPEVQLVNHYGPTETTIGSVICPIDPQDIDAFVARPLIGRPIANTATSILDRRGNSAPIGVIGELYIGGAGLAEGYLQLPELTAEKFLPDVFSAVPGARMYKTGDLARYLSDGTIELLGRIDDQVKIRGFRIELGEIEHVLRHHPAVQACTVIVREDSSGDKRLVAYVVPESETVLSVNDVRAFLAQKIPAYMIPSAFIFLAKLPLTPNGKIDRKALPEPEHTRPDLEERCVPPRTPFEKKLVQIWCEILQFEQVGIHDNFFALGGHSLLATQIISRINRAFGIEVPLRLLFETPTVAGLAARVAQIRLKTETSETLEQLIGKIEQFSDEEMKQHLLETGG